MFAHSIHIVLKRVRFLAASFTKASEKIPAILSSRLLTETFPLRFPFGVQPVPVKIKPRNRNGVR
ncbi:MAG: hypothetical protein DYH13_08145 [Alphaproteobacteria bacterium PRO2]|nr:hypothetical protein [Alphaproteobacteria bacterium PRO2]